MGVPTRYKQPNAFFESIVVGLLMLKSLARAVALLDVRKKNADMLAPSTAVDAHEERVAHAILFCLEIGRRE